MESEKKTGRWSIRVTPREDLIVRRALAHNGMSLNEYVVGNSVSAAINDLAYRNLFVLSDEQWDELQSILGRPPAADPKLANLLYQPSVLESD